MKRDCDELIYIIAGALDVLNVFNEKYKLTLNVSAFLLDLLPDLEEAELRILNNEDIKVVYRVFERKVEQKVNEVLEFNEIEYIAEIIPAEPYFTRFERSIHKAFKNIIEVLRDKLAVQNPNLLYYAELIPSNATFFCMILLNIINKESDQIDISEEELDDHDQIFKKLTFNNRWLFNVYHDLTKKQVKSFVLMLIDILPSNELLTSLSEFLLKYIDIDFD